MQEESLWQVNFDNLYFWNILNKTHQDIFVWNRNNRLHTSNKKHVHKDKKETTHVKVSEEDIHHYKYIKDKHNVWHGHKTGVQEEEAKRSSYNNKEVNTPPNKMKHNSPLQRNVFLPLTCRILNLKRNHIFSTISPPFCHDWQRVQEVRKLHLRDIKMIKGAQEIYINAWM